MGLPRLLGEDDSCFETAVAGHAQEERDAEARPGDRARLVTAKRVVLWPTPDEQRDVDDCKRTDLDGEEGDQKADADPDPQVFDHGDDQQSYETHQAGVDVPAEGLGCHHTVDGVKRNQRCEEEQPCRYEFGALLIEFALEATKSSFAVNGSSQSSPCPSLLTRSAKSAMSWYQTYDGIGSIGVRSSSSRSTGFCPSMPVPRSRTQTRPQPTRCRHQVSESLRLSWMFWIGRNRVWSSRGAGMNPKRR